MVEYVLVTVVLAAVLLGNPDVVQELLGAIRRIYQAFTYALSRTIH